MKLVLDTNTIVSAIGWGGPPRRILLALREGAHTLVTSPDLLQELTAVLRYPKLRPIARHPLLPEILAWLHRPEHLIYPSEQVDAIRVDPADNLVLEVAMAGKADVIVSGDRHILALKQFRGIPVMTAAAFALQHL
ncbi:MAG: putative toxin-antitoxin system toxin component, PIN family [bacterium]